MPTSATADTSRARSCSARSTAGSGITKAATSASRIRIGPNRGRRIRTYPVVERNESVYIWHDVERRDPFFDAPDVFASFDDSSSADDYYPQQRLYREALEMHPQYVLENGVDFAHFKFVHQTPIVPVFTRHDFDDTVSYVDFTITFEGDDNQIIDDVKSGVEAINGGLGIAVTKSWGMVDNRTISAITPVDDRTSDVRFMVYIGRKPGDSSPRAESKARDFGEEVIRQFTQDVHIWQHQRYSDPPALANCREGRVHRNPQVGHAVLSRRTRRQRRRAAIQFRERAEPNERKPQADPRIPGGDGQRRQRDDQADRRRDPIWN